MELTESQYVNISTYRPLSRSLPDELKSPRKGLINIKNKDKKCFLWCHVRHINPLNKHPERILKNDKKIAEELNYDRIEFPVQEKDFNKIEIKNNICINVFGYENKIVFPIYILDQKFEDSMDLLLLIDNDKSHYVYIKDFNRFMLHKTKNKSKKWFCKSCLQCFSSENVLIKHKENCLRINDKQSVKLEERKIKSENYFKQIPVPFKIYADCEHNLKKVKCNESSYTEKYQDHIPCNFAYKIVCIDDKFTKPTIIYRGENAAYEVIKAILEEYQYYKKIMEEHFNKNLIMTEEEEDLFQKSNNCWICKKFIGNDEDKVRDCHVTGKFNGAAHESCNLNFQLTEKGPVIFHNLRNYDSHLIFNELDKFDVKIKAIPNGLEKYMAFFLNKNLLFIDSMPIMNSKQIS